MSASEQFVPDVSGETQLRDMADALVARYGASPGFFNRQDDLIAALAERCGVDFQRAHGAIRRAYNEWSAPR